MSSKSKILKLLLIVSSIFVSSSCSYLDKFLGNFIKGDQEQTSENNNVLVESLSISPKNLVLEKNEQRTLNATVLPQNATNKNYTWSSDNPLIASVSEYGIVKGLKPGTANIKAFACDGSGVYDSCSVTVNGINYDYTYDFKDKYFNDDSSSWLCTKPGADFSNGVQIDKDMDTTITSKKEYVGGKKVFVRYHTSSNNSNKAVGHFNLSADIYNKSFPIYWVGSKTTVAEFDFDQAFVGKIELYTCAYENSIFVEGIDILIGDIVYPTSITLSARKTTLCLNESCTIDINYYPLSTTIKKFLFSSSSDPDVIEIDGTNVWATGYGEATVTVIVLGEGDRNESSTINFVVEPIKVDSIAISPAVLNLTIGDETYIDVRILPSNAENKTYTFKSNNELVATINGDGKVNAIGVGTTTIEAKSNDGGHVAYCTVVVKPVYITSISLNYTSLDMFIGDTATLVATIMPSNATDQTVIFASSDDSIATVNELGVVNAISEGTAVVEAKTKDGNHVATCTITIKIPRVTGINFNYSNITVGVGETAELTYEITPSNAIDKSVIYLSDNESVVTVDNYGVISSLKEGTATIKVKTNDGGFTSSCMVSVIKKSEINESQVNLTNMNYKKQSYCPCFGSPKLLIIPVWFTDSSNFIDIDKRENVRSDIEKSFFGSKDDVGWESVKSYYNELSDNKVHLDGVVSDWYEYDSASSKMGDYSVITLARSASYYYFENHPEDSRLNYDIDKNGFLDGVVLIYAAPNYYTQHSSNETLWAYTNWDIYTSANTTSPNVNSLIWASYDFMYDSSTSLLRTGYEYGYGYNDHCTIDTHTYIHEMGHMFGLEDYYDYTSTSRPAGGFSMQDFTIGSHDPFSVLQLGWTNPYIPVETQTIYLRPFQSSKDVILLTPSWNEAGSVFDEYFLLEFYTPTGLNELDSTYGYSSPSEKGPDELGIRLWHIDARLAYSENGNYTGPHVGINDHKCFFGLNNNSYQIGWSSSYLSDLGKDYCDFKLLQLIRNDSTSSYSNKNFISNSDLFSDGSTFTMEMFANQFVNEGKLNSNIDLGWTFSVSITGDGEDAIASVTCTKLD